MFCHPEQVPPSLAKEERSRRARPELAEGAHIRWPRPDLEREFPPNSYDPRARLTLRFRTLLHFFPEAVAWPRLRHWAKPIPNREAPILQLLTAPQNRANVPRGTF